jgi:hypothetical protein
MQRVENNAIKSTMELINPEINIFVYLSPFKKTSEYTAYINKKKQYQESLINIHRIKKCYCSYRYNNRSNKANILSEITVFIAKIEH